ncbi:MAG: 4Fe-4S dicluster domain-containing protein [Lentisphaerae bacterium]|nr:4Fe-4S dicluster domain-containing protein [Lentisphaerota bacterium]
MKRKTISIDQDKCTGCGECVTGCPEGAIQMIDGKARLVGDLLCDGLGACIGHCPVNAITIEERDAEPYSERKVMENIIQQGPNVLRAHLAHLRDHGQSEYLAEAMDVMREKGIENPMHPPGAAGGHAHHAPASGCPGSRSMNFARPAAAAPQDESGARPSQLTHWPVQLHLMSPAAPQYRGADVLLSADCVAFAAGDFHRDFLKGRALAIACPKLDEGQDAYVEKLRALIDEANINTLTVAIMQVPCCSGLLRIAQQAAKQASRKVPVKCIVVGLQGQVLKEEWVTA